MTTHSTSRRWLASRQTELIIENDLSVEYRGRGFPRGITSQGANDASTMSCTILGGNWRSIAGGIGREGE